MRSPIASTGLEEHVVSLRKDLGGLHEDLAGVNARMDLMGGGSTLITKVLTAHCADMTLRHSGMMDCA